MGLVPKGLVKSLSAALAMAKLLYKAIISAAHGRECMLL